MCFLDCILKKKNINNGNCINDKTFKKTHKTLYKNVENATRSSLDRLRVQECRARVAFEIALSDGIIMSYR